MTVPDLDPVYTDDVAVDEMGMACLAVLEEIRARLTTQFTDQPTTAAAIAHTIDAYAREIPDDEDDE
jgi:hypothetical protein